MILQTWSNYSPCLTTLETLAHLLATVIPTDGSQSMALLLLLFICSQQLMNSMQKCADNIQYITDYNCNHADIKEYTVMLQYTTVDKQLIILAVMLSKAVLNCCLKVGLHNNCFLH